MAQGVTSALGTFEAFLAGPAARAGQLRDEGESAPAKWVFGGPDTRRVDAIVTVAADDIDDLRGEVARQREIIAKHGR